MKQFLRVEVKNSEELKLLKEAFKNLPIRITKGFNSVIISPKSEDIRAKKKNNKYLQLLSALAVLEKTGFKSTTKIIKF